MRANFAKHESVAKWERTPAPGGPFLMGLRGLSGGPKGGNRNPPWARLTKRTKFQTPVKNKLVNKKYLFQDIGKLRDYSKTNLFDKRLVSSYVLC